MHLQIHCILSLEGTSYKKLQPPVISFNLYVVLHELLHQCIIIVTSFQNSVYIEEAAEEATEMIAKYLHNKMCF